MPGQEQLRRHRGVVGLGSLTQGLAKPISVSLADGNPLLEINARSYEIYKQISANRERPCRAIYMWDYYQDGTDQTKLYLVFD